MKAPQVLGIGTAVPGEPYNQMQLFNDYLRPYFKENRHAETLFRNTRIECRYLAISPDYYQQHRSTQARNEMYMQLARPLGETAIRRCLANAGAAITDVDDFIVISCTGIDTPGLDLILAGSMGMRSDLQRSSLLGMGCYAALPGLARAWQSVLAHPQKKTLVLAIEVCSLHFQPEDASTENIVASALFADGAAAVLVGGGSGQSLSTPGNGPTLVDFATQCDYQTLDQMAFHLTDHGFRMRLSLYIPALLAANLEAFVDRLLARNHLQRADIASWAVHPGSAKILSNTAQRLGLPAHALDGSFSILNDFGNMSSPTILFILEQVAREKRLRAGDYGVLLAFGPGLTLEGALLRW